MLQGNTDWSALTVDAAARKRIVTVTSMRDAKRLIDEGCNKSHRHLWTFPVAMHENCRSVHAHDFCCRLYWPNSPTDQLTVGHFMDCSTCGLDYSRDGRFMDLPKCLSKIGNR